MTHPIDKDRQLADLLRTAEAFRVAMIESGAVNHVRQDCYIKQLRALECALQPLNYIIPGALLSAGEMRERCAAWHDMQEARQRQALAEVLGIPGSFESCPGLAEARSQMADLHQSYAAAIRALPVTQ
jgi:hypothetical protein